MAQQVGDLGDKRIYGIDRNNISGNNWYRLPANQINVISSWSTNNQGNFIRYHWYEEDSGIGYNQPKDHSYLLQNSTTFEYTIDIWSLDDECGFDTVFFTDIIWKDYRADGFNNKVVRFYSGNY